MTSRRPEPRSFKFQTPSRRLPAANEAILRISHIAESGIQATAPARHTVIPITFPR
jgi:hypothetical protein